MGLIFESVPGDVRLVHRVWTAACDGATTFSSLAKATPMIAFARIGGRTTVHLRGPETKATPITCSADTEFFGIELRVGAYLPMFPPASLANRSQVVVAPIVTGYSQEGQPRSSSSRYARPGYPAAHRAPVISGVPTKPVAMRKPPARTRSASGVRLLL